MFNWKTNVEKEEAHTRTAQSWRERLKVSLESFELMGDMLGSESAKVPQEGAI